ncbi:MAG: single-stranded-DNA-specific exonuclease RecJ [Chloroflexota bacterium]
MKGCRWHLLPEAPADFLAGMDLPRLLIQLLYHRGLREAHEIEPFLAGDACLSNDPLLLPGIEAALIRIYRALLTGERIAVYGDYDVDGVAATAILVKGLGSLGARVTPYIPNRLTEGYGLNYTALQELRTQAVSLIITVDTGITAVAEVRKARELGLEVIITDHHTPLIEIPEATAVINPKLASSYYPFRELAGSGVAYKLLEALFRGMGKKEPEFTDLVALGTIADITPIVGENRYLVRSGLKLLNTELRVGIRCLKELAGLGDTALDTENIAWVIAPRLNAAGRLAHAMTGYELLVTDSPDRARELAGLLETTNAERQLLTTQVTNQAREQILAKGVSPLLVAQSGEYPLGIVGLAASKLAEEFYRPAVLVSTGGKVSSGSCRSIPEFNIILALNECCDLLDRFGGHAQAAGFTLPTENLTELINRLSQIAETELKGKELYPSLDIDAEVRLDELGGSTFQLIGRLAPFGRGNPEPAFLSRMVKVADSRTMGSEGRHLRLKLRQDSVLWDAVAFGQGGVKKVPDYLDIVYNLEMDDWQGRQSLRLNIIDFREAS